MPAYQSWGGWDINDAGWVAGLSTLDDGTNWYESPTIWVGNTPIDLSYVTTSAWGILDTWATGINNLGLVVIGPDLYWRDCDIPSYVVVPKDNDGDGVPDTWFEDKNGDGLNDLLKLIAPPSGYNAQEGFWTHIFEPRGINDAGQIILNPWTGSPCRLTPDHADADGDGNPWYADANGDGFNDLMVELIGLGGAYSYAADINVAGQVVGNSNNRAVVWNFAGETQTVTDLGLLSKSVKAMNAKAINDAGQIVGNAFFQKGETAFLVYKGTMYDLATRLTNGAGWANLQASDINNQGCIIGYGDFGGVRQSFVAIPVTQP